MITYSQIIEQLNNYNINNKLVQAYFLANCDYESNGFKWLVEKEHYTCARALQIWPNRRSQIINKMNSLNLLTIDYFPQPELFNLVYGGRMGNTILPSDGYVFKGRGLLQLTGRENYTKFMQWYNLVNEKQLKIMDIVKLLETETGAIISAIWFWLSKKLCEPAKNNDSQKVLLLINGSLSTLAQRNILLQKYKKILNI